MNDETKKYLALVGTIERSKKKPQDFSNLELQTFFNATPEQIERLREEYGKYEPKQIKRLNLDNEILEEVRQVFKKYLDTTENNISMLSLWLIGTYFHNQFETYPLLQLLAQKRSGKTRTLKLLSALAYKSDGSVSTSPTETHLFRHKEGALFFDEMENISSKERGAFRETLNAVYKRGNKIIRYKEKKTNEGREYVEDCFYPYYPLALANIAGLGDVLADRAVQIVLKRSTNLDKTRLVEDYLTNNEIIALKKKLERLDTAIPSNFFTEWNSYVSHLPLNNKDLEPFFEKVAETQIYGRALEIFFPLFVIAYLSNDLNSFLKVACEYVKLREQEEQTDDFDEILKNYVLECPYKEFTSLSLLLQSFRDKLETPEDWINSKWFGRALQRLDLIGQKRRINGKVQVLLKRNSTNATNSINTTNTTNATKQVDKVAYVAFVAEKNPIQPFEVTEL